MAQELKNILHAVGEKFTIDVQFGRYGIPAIPAGPGYEPFAVGDQVQPLPTAPYRKGGTVTGVWTENGYQKVTVNTGTAKKPALYTFRATDLTHA